MPWGRLHDRANGDAKLLALSDGAWRLWGSGLIYCQGNLTDGLIPEHALPTFGVRFKPLRRLVDELCAVLVPGKKPLWHRPGHGQAKGLHGYQINDYLDWNDSRADVLKERQRTKDRVDRFRDRLAASRESAVTPLHTPLQTGLLNALPNADETRSERSSEQGSTSTTTEDQTQDQHRSRGAAREPEDSWQVLSKLAHVVLDEADAGVLAPEDVKEVLKTRAARMGLVYDGERIRKVLDSAGVQRRLPAARGRR